MDDTQKCAQRHRHRQIEMIYRKVHTNTHTQTFKQKQEDRETKRKKENIITRKCSNQRGTSPVPSFTYRWNKDPIGAVAGTAVEPEKVLFVLKIELNSH